MKATATLSDRDLTFDKRTHRPIPVYWFNVEIVEFDPDEMVIEDGLLKTDEAFLSAVRAVRESEDYPIHLKSPRINLGDDFRFTGLGKVEGFAFVEPA